MNRTVPDRGALVATIGAVALLVSMFLDWYRYTPPRAAAPDGESVGVTAWEVFSAADVLLAALAGMVLLSAALTATRSTPALRASAGLVLSVAGIAALALVVARVAFPPGSEAVLGVLGITIDASRLGGAFVAVAAAGTMAVGGVMAASGILLEGASRVFDRLDRGL
jgi:hypothetical protein